MIRTSNFKYEIRKDRSWFFVFGNKDKYILVTFYLIVSSQNLHIKPMQMFPNKCHRIMGTLHKGILHLVSNKYQRRSTFIKVANS